MFELPVSRRDMFGRLGGGVGALALASLLSAPNRTSAESSQRPQAITHHAPRAKRVIQLFMNGGPFQADFFDPKPAINQFAGQRPKEVEFRTENKTGGLMPVPYGYRPRGESGLPVSDLLPQIGACIDDICVIRSLHCDNPNHGPALFQMNNGTITPTRPSMGSWMLYGLGSENADLPGYVVLCPGRPVRFAELWSSAFLPGENQGTYLNHTDLDPVKLLPNLRSSDTSLTLAQQRRQLELLRRINAKHLEHHPDEPALEARIRSMETAFRMQFAASEAFDIRLEPEPIREEYGKSHYAHGCLMARRLIERGVRFVQVYYGNGQPWDTHSNHDEQVKRLARDIDQPTAALLRDLKRRGLLEDTLVVWGGEFGRTSTTEGSNGRDHNHLGFTTWLAGGGVRGGTSYGATDDFAFRAVQDKVHVHDLHATILHLLGFNHEHLTYRHAGRDFRLTDVYGRVVREILA